MASPDTDFSTLTPPISVVTATLIVHVTIPVFTKLDCINFLTWRSQIEPIIDGYGLTHHLDSSTPVPAQQIESGGRSIPNSIFTSWRMHDRLLLGWLRSSISGEVLSQHVTCQTAASLWSALHRIYSAISAAKVMELRRRLQTTTKGGQSCNEFFETMRRIADQLTAVGEPVSDSDLVRYILNGLGPDFNSFIVAVTTRSDSISLSDLHGFLLTHKSLLMAQHQDPVAMYANSGIGRGRQGRGRHSSHQGATSNPSAGRGRGGPGGNRHSYSSYSGPGNSNSGQSQSAQSIGDRLVCQICNKRGHAAVICWYRDDFNLYPAAPFPSPPQQQSQFQAFLNTSTSSPNEGWGP